MHFMCSSSKRARVGGEREEYTRDSDTRRCIFINMSLWFSLHHLAPHSQPHCQALYEKRSRTFGCKIAHARPHVAREECVCVTQRRFGADGGGFLPSGWLRIRSNFSWVVVSPLPAFNAISLASSSQGTHRCLGRLVDWEIIISSATGADCHLRRDQNTRPELRPHAALSPAAAIRLFSLHHTAPSTLKPLWVANSIISQSTTFLMQLWWFINGNNFCVLISYCWICWIIAWKTWLQICKFVYWLL